MRISDWSSDVCSSDLRRRADARAAAAAKPAPTEPAPAATDVVKPAKRQTAKKAAAAKRPVKKAAPVKKPTAAKKSALAKKPVPVRSEEHTSELQSLMRSSYAVFCLKNKKPQTTKKI